MVDAGWWGQGLLCHYGMRLGLAASGEPEVLRLLPGMMGWGRAGNGILNNTQLSAPQNHSTAALFSLDQLFSVPMPC